MLRNAPAAVDVGPYADIRFRYAWFDNSVRGDQSPEAGDYSQEWNVSVEGAWAHGMRGERRGCRSV